MFWNVENCFTPSGDPSHRMTPGRFRAKTAGIAKTIYLVADVHGNLPDMIGLAEIGDSAALRSLIWGTSLHKADYGRVHYESLDRRGIDCALLYRRSRFRAIYSKPRHLYDDAGTPMLTRDILLAVLEDKDAGDTIAVLVNHHPSKVGRDSERRRQIAMRTLGLLRDSLLSEGISRIVAVGDFNDEVEPAAGISSAYGASEGTIKFQGKWEKIDGCPILEGFSGREYIFDSPILLEADRSYSGIRPRRTFSGPRYLGGLSDHLPVVLIIQNK